VDPEAYLIHMGFPRKQEQSHLAICSCHNEIKAGGYLCPQCGAKVCELPTSCKICNLPLVSSPHLARSYHHLFPVPVFAEVKAAPAIQEENNKLKISIAKAKPCSACRHESSPDQLVQCPRCKLLYCLTCDAFIHETLHVCPGCAMLPAMQQGGL